MKKVITIVGARPQFVKAAMVSRAIGVHNVSGTDIIEEHILHTGQHYDSFMSDVFFNDMNIPKPAWTLHGDGSETHGMMTGRMLVEIERILMEESPDSVIVYGDTNSTLAGAIAASKLHIPVVHVEAGLRSFNKQMPEEINRILTDHVSSILCCPTSESLHNLANEGIYGGVYHVGDVMYDAAVMFGRIADASSNVLDELGLTSKSFRLCTLHRAENVDSQERLSSIVNALIEVATEKMPLVFPVHPRTKARLDRFGLMSNLECAKYIRITRPVGFIDMTMLEKHALTVLTDSGGVQKEAYFHRTPCITLREETEWTETVDAGWNRLAGCETEDIIAALDFSTERDEINEYGNGNAADEIVKLI